MSKIKTALEKFYGLPLKKIFQVHHIKNKKTMLQISKETGLIRQSIMHCCKANGVKFRTLTQHHKDLPHPSGKSHWAFGKTKKTSEAYRKHSQAMIANNPIHDPKAAAKRARTIGKTFRKKPLPQEVAFRKKLRGFGLKFRSQYAIGEYTIDFFLPLHKVCIEVDSSWKWDKKRYQDAARRDKKLALLGYKTVRFNKLFLDRADPILKELASHSVNN